MLKELDHDRPHATDGNGINDVWYTLHPLMRHIY